MLICPVEILNVPPAIAIKVAAYPKIMFGCDIKSVMRSSILRGSSTNVGNATLERSMPILDVTSLMCICRTCEASDDVPKL